MGQFISVSVILGAGQPEVVSALENQVRLKHGVFQAEPRKVDDDDTLVIHSAHGNTSIFFPANDMSWWETSQAISQTLKTVVFAFHIHDSDLWMYELYRNGEKLGAFNPIPEYWMELSDEERQYYSGDAKAVADCVPGLKAADIKKYFVTWDLDADDPGKAYPSDEYPYGDQWQLLDFMRKLNLPYPIDAAGKPLGPTYEFIIPSPKP